MTNRGRGSSNRGRSRGRPYTKGPQRAAPNTRHTSSYYSEHQSPSRDFALPAHDNNNVFCQQTGESTSPFASPYRSPAPSKEAPRPGNDSSIGGEADPPGDQVNILETSQANSDVGDKGLQRQIDPPRLGGTKDDSLTAPSIELVLSELREIKQQVLEIKDIKQQISKLDIIESTTGDLSNKLTGVMNRTSELETAVRTNSARIREYDDQFSTMQTTVGKHERSFSNLKAIKEDFCKTNEKAAADMKQLVSIQKDQVVSFQAVSESVKKNILAEVDQKLAEAKRRSDFQALTDQAFNNRHNLVVVGLPEIPDKDTPTVVSEFFSNTLKVNNIQIGSAYRMGSESADSSDPYTRPILVHFPILPQRNRVWRKRSSIPGQENVQKVRIHADLPKELRDGVQALYMVAKAASSSDKYQTARVRNYTLELDDQVFLPSELEMLPRDIRPSSLAAPRSNSALAFFSKHAIFSNHHPSFFRIGEQPFYSMEQFLALRRAQLSGKPSFITKASEATDPVQAKYVLSALRQDNTQQWDDQLESTVLEGLEAKFRQNPQMKDYLCSTGDLSLGEASTNPRWGVGMSLDDKDILDVSKWNNSGNLLGRSLMRLRSIFIGEAQNQPAWTNLCSESTCLS